MTNATILTRDMAAAWASGHRRAGRRVVFTNGCFDVLHVGHVRLLAAGRAEGDVLVVAINDDASVARLKGPTRPVVGLADRLELVAALRWVDAVVAFSEDTPLAVLRDIRPDVLVKGADYEKSAIVGAEDVEAAGGRVVRVPLVTDRSTSAILERVSRDLPGRS